MTGDLASVVGRLRRACVPMHRNLSDVQCNAMLWLSVRAGVSTERSSFRLPAERLAIDEARLTDAVYLAAIGFLVAARVLPLPSAESATQALDDVCRRRPHTVELSGYADDPLCGIGLLLLARALGRGEITEAIQRSLADHAVYSPAVALALGVADVGPRTVTVIASNMCSSWLAAAVLADRVDQALARRLFPALDPIVAGGALLRTVAHDSHQIGVDADSMLVLAALELAPASTTAPDAPSPERLPAAGQRKSTILFLAANPDSTNTLALDEEAREIEAKLRAARYRDAFLLRTRWAVRPDDLLQALNEDGPSIVHFSGHGTGTPGIVLHDDAAGPRLVSGSALRQLFSAVKGEIRVVVLSACHSAEQAREIATVIDCVVGMKRSIGDEAARKFAAAFYRALAFGRSVGNAFAQGLAAIALHGLGDTDVPELLLRAGVDADRVVLIRSNDSTS